MTENLEEQLHTGELEQKLEEAKSHEQNVFAPEFIQFFPEIKKKFGLTWLQTLIYGFIRWYLINPRSSGKFYFTNEQLASIFDVSEVTISGNINKLADKKLIETEYELRGGGGKIRYVRLIRNFKSDLKSTLRLTQSRVCENNNKIKKNKNNNKELKEKAKKIISYWNDSYNRKFKVPAKKGWLTNFERWLETYSLDEIKEAIDTAQTKHDFYKDKITPDMLFRSHEDRIGQMLNYKPKSSGASPKKVLT